MRCSICDKVINGMGNNASPFKRDECCDECNESIVLKLRLFLSGNVKKQLLVITPYNDIIFWEFDVDDVPLKDLQNLVGGYIELYPIENEHYHFIVDEEGFVKDKAPNELAYELFGIQVLGDLVLCPKENFS